MSKLESLKQVWDTHTGQEFPESASLTTSTLPSALPEELNL